MWTAPPTPEFAYYYERAIYLSMRGNRSLAHALVHSTNLIQSNFLQLTVTMDDIVTIETDKAAITLEGIIGNLGGILNLWIGFTFITIMEVVDFFLTIAMDRFWAAELNDDNKKVGESNKNHRNVSRVIPS